MPDNDCELRNLMPVADNLFQAARDEYRFYALEIKNRQTKIQNIYFWIASAMFSAYAAAFHGLFTGDSYIHLGLVGLPCTLVSKCLVCAAFGICIWVIITGVDAMRGREAGEDMLGKSSAFNIFESYVHNPAITPEYAMRDLLYICRENSKKGVHEAVRLGKHLRRTSYALIMGIICGLLAFLI